MSVTIDSKERSNRHVVHIRHVSHIK
jgi:hypothetical protein